MARRVKKRKPVSRGLFFQYAVSLASLAEATYEEFHNEAKDDLLIPTSAPLVGCILLLTTSIEVSLKYHYFLYRGTTPTHHEHLKLYKALHIETQSHWKEQFDPVISRNPGPVVTIEPNSPDESPYEHPLENINFNLEKVLRHSGKLFDKFRFLAEKRPEELFEINVVYLGALRALTHYLHRTVLSSEGRSTLEANRKSSWHDKGVENSEESSFLKDLHLRGTGPNGKPGFDSQFGAIIGGSQMSHPAKRLARQFIGLSGDAYTKWININAPNVIVAGFCACTGIEQTLKGILALHDIAYEDTHSLVSLFRLLPTTIRCRSNQVLQNIFLSDPAKMHRLSLRVSGDQGDDHSPSLGTIDEILKELDANYFGLRYPYEVDPDASKNRKYVYLQLMSFVSDSLTLVGMGFTDAIIEKMYNKAV